MRRAWVMVCMIGCAAGLLQAQSVTIEVAAGDHDRVNTPIVFDLPSALAEAEHVKLERADTGIPIDAQIDRIEGDDVPKVVFLLGQKLEAGTTRRYVLSASDEAPAGNVYHGTVEVERDAESIRVAANRLPVLEYHIAALLSPEPSEPYYRRSGQIHPLHAPSGAVVTDDFPPDHYHQHGVMFAWTKTTFQGRAIDFWNQKKLQGTVEHNRVIGAESGPVFGRFEVGLRHVNLNAPNGPADVLDEIWSVRVYNFTDVFVMDLISVQRAVRNPLQVNQYHYGGMAIRGARSWLNPPCRMLTRLGDDRSAGNHTRPGWVDMQGPVDVADHAPDAGPASIAGVTVMDHPDNVRFPQPVRLHPDKPYFCFSPQVLGGFDITANVPYISRYRFVTRDGELDRTRLDALWQNWTDPPTVRVVK
ncbi:hypothetical protein HED60_08720 [Planctomycetales bacterium ZRK34]|nr:hypothetical protein HED60_08720 [Planctomycetales bacterium ZRK34]